MIIEKHLIGQTVIVHSVHGTSSLMWIYHSDILFSLGHDRKTNELSKSDCSVYERCRQRYLVYYES